jgi:hypothetical protein
MKDQKLKDLKVKNYLFQAINRNILETNLGFHEAEVSGVNLSKASSIASPKENF